jgi:hypothetical protein
MKKYFAAGAVAVMVFAFAAMAASLNVSAPTLQVGETEEGALSCVDAVDVIAWGYNDYTGKVTRATVQAVNNRCDAETLFLTLLDEDGNRLSAGGHNGQAFLTENLGDKNDDSFFVDLTRGDAGAEAGVDGDVIGGVRFGIDQGPGVS